MSYIRVSRTHLFWIIANDRVAPLLESSPEYRAASIDKTLFHQPLNIPQTDVTHLG